MTHTIATITALAVEGPAWRDPGWLTAAGTVLTAALAGIGTLLGVILNRQRRLGVGVQVAKAEASAAAADAAATRAQVQNSHSTNLRDDLDAKQAEALAAMAELSTMMAGLQADVAALRTGQQHLTTRMDGVGADLRQLRHDHAVAREDARDSHIRIHARIDELEDRTPSRP
ncbi:MAG: hypothetical protein Q3999_05035 [Buchananella hordeovulneris]|nr:hypothetical protein [Buchananella hordeovulneris]